MGWGHGVKAAIQSSYKEILIWVELDANKSVDNHDLVHAEYGDVSQGYVFQLIAFGVYKKEHIMHQALGSCS